jgi:formylglycine-generating enzyme required for sulfatase activity
LVIGNDNYQNVSKLSNAVNDARAMAQVLRECGFEVKLVVDANFEQMGTSVNDFINSLHRGDVALFYYSGHAMQVNGENYLAPVNLVVNNESQVRYRSLNVSEVLEQMEGAGADLQILILDACRNNPFAQNGRAIGGRGLATITAGKGTFISYATAPGKTADDNSGGANGLFTTYLLQALREPGLKLEEAFKQANGMVVDESHSKQVPWIASSVNGDFYFRPTASAAYKPPPYTPPPATPIDRGPQPGSTKVNAKDGQRYVWIPPGSFIMGCSPGDTECGDEEKPAHNVSITKGFWLGQTPVTQAAYKRVMGTNPSYFKGDNLPVEQVTWDEAKQYCEAIGGRLPTEAEWEYAARAGTAGERYGNLDAIAWYQGNSGGQTHPVGTKASNAWNLYDMLGNVWQWTADWYGGTYSRQQESGGDPQGPAYGQYRVLRGGSWLYNPRVVRVSYRGRGGPADRFNKFGVRCVGE